MKFVPLSEFEKESDQETKFVPISEFEKETPTSEEIAAASKPAIMPRQIRPPIVRPEVVKPEPREQTEMTAWEPSLLQRLGNLFPGSKEKAWAQVTARQIAKEQNIPLEQAYRQMQSAVGAPVTGQPMFNPQGRPPIRATAEAVPYVAEGILNLPKGMAEAGLRAYRAGDIADSVDLGAVDTAISYLGDEAKNIFIPNLPEQLGLKRDDPNYQAFSGLGKSLGFSVMSMVSSALAGTAAGLATTNPLVGIGAGMATSGTLAYRASKDEFLDRLRAKLNKDSQRVFREPLSKEAWENAKKEFESAAVQYGAWEAIPEAIGNAIFLKAFGKPLAKATPSKLTQALEKVNAYAVENLTETATGMGQNAAELKAGLSPQEISIAEAFKQQFIQTALTTGIMSGGMKGKQLATQFYNDQVLPRIDPASALAKAIKADIDAVAFSPEFIRNEAALAARGTRPLSLEEMARPKAKQQAKPVVPPEPPEEPAVVSTPPAVPAVAKAPAQPAAQPEEVPLIPGMVSGEMLAPEQGVFVPIEKFEAAPETVTTETRNVPAAEPIEGADRVGVPAVVQPQPEERKEAGPSGVGEPERGGVAVGERPAAAPAEGARAEPPALTQAKAEPVNIIQTPTGKFVFAGRVPTDALYEEGATPEQIQQGRQFGERFGPKQRVFDTREEAVLLLNSLGYEAVPETKAEPVGVVGRRAGNDPASFEYSLLPDGRLIRSVQYDDGDSSLETLVTTKQGDEVWVSKENYARGNYFPVQLDPQAAAKKAREDLSDVGATEASSASSKGLIGSELPTPPIEPPVPAGKVRVYHSGSVGEGDSGRWVSTDKKYASNYRPDLPLFYFDVDEKDPRVNDPDYPEEQGVKQGFTFNFELNPQEASQLKPTSREEPKDAQHIEDGNVEPATPDVVKKALDKSEKNTDFNWNEAKKYLIGEIDRSLESAPKHADSVWAIPVSTDETTAQKEREGYVTFSVPGDGTFKIRNTQERLAEFRELVEKRFKAKRAAAPKKAPSSAGAIESFLEDGEYLSAYEYSKATGRDLKFGASSGTAPNAYFETEPVSLAKGFTFFVGKNVRKPEKGKVRPWSVIEESTGLSVGSGATKQAAIAAAKEKIANAGPDKLKDLIGKATKRSQSELESDFVNWAEVTQEAAMSEREAEYERGRKGPAVSVNLAMPKEEREELVSSEEKKTKEQEKSESQFIEQNVKEKLDDIAKDFMVGDLVRFGNTPGVVIGLEGDYVRFRPDSAKSPKAYQRVLKNSLTFVSRPDTTSEVSYSKAQDNKFGEEAGQLNADMGNLIQLLGANMYQASLADVTIKELLQNAFDAIKGATSSVNAEGKKINPIYKSGHIEITVNRDDRSITIKDDARGMTPDIVRQAFFTVAGSDKSDLPPNMRSGGLGLAKMGFMLGSERLILDTVRDGVRVTVDTTAKDIANNNFKLKKSPAPKGEHGTSVTVIIPEKYTDPKTGESKDIYFPYGLKIDPLTKPLIGPAEVKLTVNAFGNKTDAVLPVGVNFPYNKYTKFKANFDWGSADIYFSIDRNNSKFDFEINHQVLSSGVYQFSPEFSINNEKIPYDIIVDVKPNVDARHPDYPFENSRERFKGRLKKDIESLSMYLGQIARGYEARDLQESFQGIVSMPRVEAGEDIAGVSEKLKKTFGTQGAGKPAELKPLPKEVTVTADAVQDTKTKQVLVDIKAKEAEKQKEATFKGEKIPSSVDFMIDMKQDPKLPIFHNNTNVDYLDIGRQYGEPEKFFAELGTLLVEMKEEMANSGMYGYEKLSPDNLFFAGVSIDKQYGGVHIKVPYKAVFVNPFYSFGARTLFGVRQQLLNTMIHEIAHTGSMDHGVAHNTNMIKVEQYLADEGTLDYYRDALLDILRRHESTFTAMRDAYGQSTTRNTAKSLEDYGKDTSAASARGDRGGVEYAPSSVSAGERPSRGEGVSEAEAVGREGKVGRGTEEADGVELENIEFKPSRKITPLGFYSALADGVQSISINASSPLGWKNAIKGLINKGQVKAEEVEWTGVNDWLDLQEGKVTKQQVTDYLKSGGVQVEETVLGGRAPWRERLDLLETRGARNLNAQERQELEQLRDRLDQEGPTSEPESLQAKFGSYTLPGGENYREVLLTLPLTASNAAGLAEATRLLKEAEELEKQAMVAWTEYGSANAFSRLNEQARDLRRRATAAEKAGGTESYKYQSSHWEQPNVLAHIRVNDRTDSDGKSILFVEEIQSDWGQEGKKKGFQKEKPITPISKKEFNNYVDKLLDDYIEQQVQAGKNREEAERRGIHMQYPQLAQELGRSEEYARMRAAYEAGLSGGERGIPAAPFVTKTEGWLNLALKRIVTMAVEGGYDRVAFVNGEQSADRYNLSKQIEALRYSRDAKTGKYNISFKRIGDNFFEGAGEFTAEKLPDVVGKEVAEKIVTEAEAASKQIPDANAEGLLSGLDLKVGGEGMKTFYDKIVPAALNKLLPKVGGTSLEVVKVGGEKRVTYADIQAAEQRRDFDEAERLTLIMERQELGRGVSERGEYQAMQQLGFDVTDAMKEKVSGGLPLFNLRRSPDQIEEPYTDEDVGNSRRIRDELISEYSKLRRALGRVPEKVAEGETDIGLQRRVGQMLQTSRDLQYAIRMTKVRQDSPADFLAKAAKEFADGNISEEVFAVVQDLYKKNPELLDGLMLSVRAPKKPGAGTAGTFSPIRRLVTLFKGTTGVDDPETIRHEVTHSLELMMTPEQRAVVIRAWAKAIARAMRQNPDEVHQRYFAAVRKFMEEPTLTNMKKARAFLPSYEMYQYLNPSEYWAVNAEPLLKAQLGTAWDRFKKSVRGLFESLKKVLGFDNKSDIYKTFAQVMSGDKNRINQEALVEYIKKVGEDLTTLENIEPDEKLLKKYSRPHTPMLDQTPVKTFITKTYQNGKEVFKDFVDNPAQAAKDTGNAFSDALLTSRNKAIWYGAGLESRDFERYQGQLRTSENLVTASVALDNAIRSGNIGVEVITKGGLQYNAKMGNFVAVNRDLGMKGVYKAEAAIRKRLGNQLGTDIIQGYLEAKRSISIMDEFYNREAAYEAAKDTVAMLKQTGATPKDIEQAEAIKEVRKDELESVKRAVSSVNMSEDEMREFAALDDRHPELRVMMDNWNAINQNLLHVWRQVGLLSQSRYEQLSAIKDYVPWYRIMNDAEDIHSPIQTTTRTLTNIGKEKLFKRGRPISIVDFRAKQGQTEFKINPSSVVNVEVNGQEVDPALVSVSPSGDVNLNLQLNDQDLVVFKTNREIENIIDNMTRNVMRMTVNGLRQYAANRIVREYASRDADGKVMTFKSPDPSKGRFSWVLDGKKVVVEIQDPLVAEAIYGMENINLKMFAPLAAVANFTRRTITLSGVFQVKQVFKDAPTAAFVTGVKNPFALIGGVWKGFLTSLTDTDPVVDILRAAGIGGYHSPARTPEAEVKRRIGVMNRNVYSTFIKVLDHIGDSSDMAQRVATYKRVMKETGDEMQALYQAANVINFLHHGSSGIAQAAVKLVPFMGAYANSIDVLTQALMGGGLKGMKRQKALKRLAITGSLLSMTTILYCMLAGSDPEYDELDDQTKLRNIIIPGTKIILPMNTSAALFFKAIPELIYNAIMKRGTDSEMDRRQIMVALAEVARDSLLGPEPVPAGVKPVVEVAIDHSFFTGRTVIPQGLKDVESAKQYVASTSELAKFISAKLSISPTNSELANFIGEKLSISPINVDHLIRGIFGTVGATAQWVSNSIGTLAENRPEMTAKETPVTGAFLRPEVPRGREDLFYDLKKKVDQKYETWKLEIDRENFDAADKYLEKYEGLIGLREYVNETDSALKEINQQIRRLGETTSKDMTPKERREEIEELQRIRQEILEPVRELRREVFQ